MDISIFLARFLGLYLVIVLPAVCLNRHRWKKILGDFSQNLALVYLSGIFGLTLGLFVVLVHNIWEADWRILITLLGWLAIVKGLVRIYLPEKLPRLVKKFGARWLITSCVIFFLIGLFLLYKGFAQ